MIDPRVDIGHVHLKVADLDRALDFYCGVLGFELQQRFGDQAAFVSRRRLPPPHRPEHVGVAGRLAAAARARRASTTSRSATRTGATLADALRRVVDAGIPLEGASDHGVSEAIYLRDPDGNGVELYRDRPREEWPRPPGGEGVAMVTAPLDVRALLAELE